MKAEFIISICITIVCISPVLILGIIQFHSKKPVGFWAGKEPPRPEQITDIKAYNHRHGMMWIFYGVGFILCFLSGFFFGKEWGYISGILSTVEAIGGLFVMIAYHNRIERKYYKE